LGDIDFYVMVGRVEELPIVKEVSVAWKNLFKYCKTHSVIDVSAPFTDSTIGLSVMLNHFSAIAYEFDLQSKNSSMFRYFLTFVNGGAISINLNLESDPIVRLLASHGELESCESFQEMAGSVLDNYRSNTRHKELFNNIYHSDDLSEFRQNFESALGALLNFYKRRMSDDVLSQFEQLWSEDYQLADSGRKGAAVMLMEIFWNDFERGWPDVV